MREWIASKTTQLRSESGLRAQLIRSALGVGGLKLLSLPLGLLSSALLGRGLGPEGFGQYAFVIAVITMLSLPIASGISQLLVREVVRNHEKRNWALFRGVLHRARQWVIGVSISMVLVLLIAVAMQGSWALDSRLTLLLIASMLLPLMGLNAIRASALIGLRKVVFAEFPQLLVRPVCQLSLIVAMLLLGILNPAMALLAQVAASAIALFCGSVLLRRVMPTEASSIAPIHDDAAWLRAFIPFTLLAASSLFNAQIGILILGILGTDNQVAALRVAQSGSELVVFSLVIISIVVAPHITRAYQKGEMQHLQALSRQSARAALVVALPIALPLIIVGGPIIRLVFGDAYVGTAAVPMAILAAGQLAVVAFGLVGQFLSMSGFERDTLYCQFSALLAHVMAAIFLVPAYGATGSALAIVISLVTLKTSLAYMFVRRLKLRPTAL